MIKSVFIILLILPFLSFSKGFVPNSFKADFKEERIKIISKKKVYSVGSIEYKFPSHLRFEVKTPHKTTLVINPKKTWYYNPALIAGEKGELNISSTRQNSLSKIFDILKSGVKVNKDYKVEKKNGYYELRLSKANAKTLGVQRINLFFSKEPVFKNIESIKIFYGKKRKTYFFTNLKENVSLSQKRFTFKVPANTNINKL